jgi:uncharacterized membrane protein
MSADAIEPTPRPAEVPTLLPRAVAVGVRLLPLDALRGTIMVVMALDHASALIAQQHPPPEAWSNALPRYDSTLAFLTRWVTHLAAPGFFFLLGAGMMLFADSRRALGWSQVRIWRHFALRGLILIALQLLVENLAWQLGGPLQLTPVYIGVLFALGGAMIAGALLVRLPAAAQAGLGLAAIVATHLLLTRLTAQPTALLRLLAVPGLTEPVVVNYPLIPWLGVACLGMAFGRWLLADRPAAYRWSLPLGAACLLLFVAVRWSGGFGNIRPPEGSGWVAFLNVVKYPPSIVFLLLTLGIDLAILGLLARAGGALASWVRPLVVLGQSPLLFYLAHLYLYGAIGRVVAPSGMPIVRMYPYWLAGLVLLYFVCRWYGSFKQRQAPASLWRLL